MQENATNILHTNFPHVILEEEPNSDFNHKRSKMSFIWSIIIFLLNIWILFSSIFWFSVQNHPDGVMLFIELTIEWIMFSEVIFRFLIRMFFLDVYKDLDLLHVRKKPKVWDFIVLIISSFPFLSLDISIYGIESEEGRRFFSYLIILKVLRCFEIQTVLSKLEETLFYKKFKTLILIKFLMNFTYVLLITHISTCSWLFIDRTHHVRISMPGNSPYNPFKDNLPYFQRMKLEDAPIAQKYIDSSVWAVSTLTGCSFGDVTPRTVNEILVSLLVFLTGMILLAITFSDFASLMYLLDIEKDHIKKKMRQALRLCKILKLPDNIRAKVQAFYSLDKEGFSQTQYLPAIKALPKSLHTDIILWINREMINKVNLFNFGSPSFVLSVATVLYPKVSMAGDYITKVGEFAEEMYFIKEGEVEVLATDNKTRIAILREGAYFGEIGLLLTGKRTVTLRALTFCVFEVIHKDDFDQLMINYPEQKEFLYKLASQRVKISNPEDIDNKNNISRVVGERIESMVIAEQSPTTEKPPKKFSSKEKITFRSRSEIMKRKFVDLLKTLLTKNDEILQDLDANFVILPMSRFYAWWSYLISLATIYYCAIVPYSISFQSPLKGENTGLWYTLDILANSIYLLDILICMNTAIKIKASYITNRSYIMRKYMTERLALDFVAFFPIDYIMLALGVPIIFISWIRLLKLLKITRLVSLLFEVHVNSSKKNKYGMLTILAIFFMLLNHLAACIMHAICQSEYKAGNYVLGGDLFQAVSNLNRVQTPIADQPAPIRYATFIYWAFSVSSSGAYGDISAVAPAEKVFQVISMLLFRVYFAFIAAEAANIVTSGYSSNAKNVEKKKIYEEWMKHLKLPKSVMERVRRFNDYVLNECHGLDKNEILNELPCTTKNEIYLYLLNDVLKKNAIFPENEVGLHANAIQCFKFINITKGEYVFRAGETAEAIYFILEGSLLLLSTDETSEITILNKCEVFGEMSILEESTGVRTKNAQAASDLSLAELSLNDLKRIWERYPVVKRRLIQIANRRNNKQPKEDKNKPILHELDINLFRNNQVIPSFEVHSPSKLENLSKSVQNNEFKRIVETFKELNSNNENEIPSPEQENQSNHKSPKIKTSFIGLEYDKEPKSPPIVCLLSPIDKPADPDHTLTAEFGKSFRNLHFEEDFTLQTNQQNLTHHNVNSNLEKNILEGSSSTSEKEGESLNLDFEIERDDKPLENLSHSANYGKLNQIQRTFYFIFQYFETKFRRHRIILINLVLIYNLVLEPLDLALKKHAFNELTVTIEIVIVFIFTINFIVNLQDYLSIKKKKNSSHPTSKLKRRKSSIKPKEDDFRKMERKHNNVTLSTIILDFLYIIPFSLIFHASGLAERKTNFFLISLQLIRLLCVNRLLWIFNLNVFKKRFALGTIITILCVYLIMNHIFACLFMVMANLNSNFNDTWLAKIPAPQFDYPNNVREVLDADEWTIYLHASYWSYVTTSHIGVGDVVGITSGERFYSSFVIFVSTILYAFLFGSLASIVEDLRPAFQKFFEKNYRYVLEYAKTSKLENFVERIHKYYSYIWLKDKGIDEDALLNELPISLKYDIFLLRYSNIIRNSRFFKDSSDQFEQKIFFTFCKKYKCEIFMENEIIISNGQKINDVYFILDGEVEVMNNDSPDNEYNKLKAGQYFGGIVQNITQVYDIKAIKITKVAVIEQCKFIQFIDAYPDWYNSLAQFEKVHQMMQNFMTRLKVLMNQRKKKQITAFNLLKKALTLNPFRRQEIVSPGKLNLRSLYTTPKKDVYLSVKNSPRREEDIEIGKETINTLNPITQRLGLMNSEPAEEIPTLTIEPFSNKSNINVNEKAPKDDLPPKEPFIFNKNKLLFELQRIKNSHSADSKLRARKSLPLDLNDQGQSDIKNLTKTPPNLRTLQQGKDSPKGKKRIPNPSEAVLISKKVSQNEEVLRNYIHPDSTWKYFYELVHTIIILYTIFGVPIYVCFDLEPGAIFITLEVLVLLEQITRLILQLRTPQYLYGKLTLKTKVIVQSLLERGLITELIAIIPLNLILSLAGARNPRYICGILRMNRIILILNLPHQFSLFGAKWIKITQYLRFIRPMFYLAFVWHFTSCLWNWFLLFEINDTEGMTWYNVLALREATVWQKYILCLLFTMNIATTAGYPEMIIYNNYERAVWILYVYFGDALFGLTFAWFAANAHTLPAKFNFVFEKIRRMDYVLQEDQIPLKLRDKLENYFAYIVDTRNQNKSCLEALSGKLPLSTLKDMQYLQAKSIHSIPLIKEFEHNKMFLNELIQNLKPMVYLPGDYITSRNEHGNEMFVIAEGIVQILSPNEKKVLCNLQEGSYFGELGLYTTTKRLTSFVAGTFCLVYILERETLNNILKKFPHTQNEFQNFVKKRLENCVLQASCKQDQVQQAYTILGFVNESKKKKLLKRVDIEELLRASEIPRVSTNFNKEKSPKQFDDDSDFIIFTPTLEQKPRLNAVENKDEEENLLSFNSSLEEYVDDEEIELKDIDTKKNTFRVKTKLREKRYSRVNMGKEKSVSKSHGITLRWGINMD